MTAKNDGGAAFPFTHSQGAPITHDGMSLRDWFAGQALIGIGDWTPWPEGVASIQMGDPRIDLRKPESQRARAEWAYAQADAMIAARDAQD